MKETKKITLPILKCLRCSHRWYPRGEEYPKVCPKCKSPWWNVPKKKVEKNNSIKE